MFYGKCEARRNYLRNQESVGVEPNARENLTDNSGCGENGVKHGNGLRGELVAFAGFNALRVRVLCLFVWIKMFSLCFLGVGRLRSVYNPRPTSDVLQGVCAEIRLRGGEFAFLLRGDLVL